MTHRYMYRIAGVRWRLYSDEGYMLQATTWNVSMFIRYITGERLASFSRRYL